MTNVPAADPFLTPGSEPSAARGGRRRLLLWLSAAVVLLGLVVLGFHLGRDTSKGPEPQVPVAPATYESQPSTAEGMPPAVPSPTTVFTSEEPSLSAAAPEAGGAPQTPPSQPGTVPPGPPAQATVPGSPPPPSPTELAVQFVGEPDLRVDSAYETRRSSYGGVTGFLVRGTVSNPSQNRIEKVVLTFTATGAIVVSQATYEALIRPPGTAVPATPGPYWNPEVILAYQATVVPNLAPGETRPFEFVAPTNLRSPPGLKSGEVVQAGQPLKASLLVRTEGTSPSGTPVFPLQRP